MQPPVLKTCMLLIMTLYFRPQDQLFRHIHKYYRNKLCALESPAAVQSKPQRQKSKYIYSIKKKVQTYLFYRQTINTNNTFNR